MKLNGHHRHVRAGSTYLVVMGMAVLVCTVTLGALLAARAQVRVGAAGADFAVARLCARAGIEVSLLTITNTPSWRTSLGNGTWFNNAPLGQGAFTVVASDPLTGDVTAQTNHPVVLTSTGTKGAAAYTMQVTVQVGVSSLGCLDVSVCSDGDLTLSSNAKLTSTQLVATNGNLNNGGTLNAGAEAVGKFGGGGIYAGSQQSLSAAVSMPDATHVFDYYVTNGTSIPLAALAQSNSSQLIANPSFETNVAGWYVFSPNASNTAVLALSTAQHQDGGKSLLISGRAAVGDVPAIDIPLSGIRAGDTYSLSVPVYAKANGNVQATLVIQATGGTVSFSTASVALKSSGGWVTCSGNITPTWTGTLTKATLTLTTTNSSKDLYIDKLSMKDTSLPPNGYVMDRVVLSPASNPYGATTNTQGIYVLDCANQNVTIGPCRIVGTLVLINTGTGCAIAGPITWETAVPGYPALLMDGKIAIGFDQSAGLSESSLGVNFNPAGTPYPYAGGAANTNATDAFPSTINGIIYAGGDMTFSSNPAVVGNVVSAGKISIQTTLLNVTFSNAAYINPPPGFASSKPAVVANPGSWRRVAN